MALPIHDTLLNGVTVRQDPACAQATSQAQYYRTKLAQDTATYQNNPTLSNQQAVAKDRQQLAYWQNQQVSVTYTTVLKVHSLHRELKQVGLNSRLLVSPTIPRRPEIWSRLEYALKLNFLHGIGLNVRLDRSCQSG